jgi:hypothetical protein
MVLIEKKGGGQHAPKSHLASEMLRDSNLTGSTTPDVLSAVRRRLLPPPHAPGSLGQLEQSAETVGADHQIVLVFPVEYRQPAVFGPDEGQY